MKHHWEGWQYGCCAAIRLHPPCSLMLLFTEQVTPASTERHAEFYRCSCVFLFLLFFYILIKALHSLSYIFPFFLLLFPQVAVLLLVSVDASCWDAVLIKPSFLHFPLHSYSGLIFDSVFSLSISLRPLLSSASLQVRPSSLSESQLKSL